MLSSQPIESTRHQAVSTIFGETGGREVGRDEKQQLWTIHVLPRLASLARLAHLAKQL